MKRTLLNSLAGLILFLLYFGIAMQVSWVQTQAGNIAAAWLSNKTGFDVHIEKLHLKFFSTLSLSSFHVRSIDGDTLMFGQQLDANIKTYSFAQNELFFESIRIEKGGFYLVHEKNDSLSNLNRFLLSFSSKSPQEPSENPFSISFGSIQLCEAAFRLNNKNHPGSSTEFKPENLGIREIELETDDFHIHKDSIYIHLTHLSALDHSGLGLKNLKGLFLLTNKSLGLYNFELETLHSQVYGNFIFRFDSMADFSHFTQLVKWDVDLGISNIAVRDLGLFVPIFKNLPGDFRIKGRIEGTLSDLKANNFRILVGTVTQFDAQLNITGLPNIKNTLFKADISRMVSGYYDLIRFPIPGLFNPLSNRNESLPSEIDRMGIIKFQGSFLGYLHDFNASGKLECGIGKIFANIHLKQDQEGVYHYNASLNSDKFNVGQYFGLYPQLGIFSMNGELNGKGFTLNDINANFKGTVSEMFAMGYPYTNLFFDAHFEKKIFNGNVSINDQNIDLVLDGLVNLTTAKPEINLKGNIKNLHPVELGWFKDDSSLVFNSDLIFNFKGSQLDDFNGHLFFSNTRIKRGKAELNMNEFNLQAQTIDHNRTLELFSDVADLTVEGKFMLNEVFNDLKWRFHQLFPYQIDKPKIKPGKFEQNFTFALHLKNPNEAIHLWNPKLTIHNNTICYGSYNKETGEILSSFQSQRIDWGNYHLKKIEFLAQVSSNTFNASLKANQFYPADSVHLDNLLFSLRGIEDSLSLNLKFNNNTTLKNSLDLNGYTLLSEAPNLSLNLLPSTVFYEDSSWTFGNGGAVKLSGNHIYLKHISLFRQFEIMPLLTIDGRLGNLISDSLQVQLNRFPIELVNGFIPDQSLRLKGRSSGSFTGFSLLDNPYFISTILVQDLSLNEIEFGNLSLNSTFDNKDNTLLVNALLSQKDKNVLILKNAKIKPNDKSQMLDLAVELNQFDITGFQPSVRSLFSELQGKLSGRIAVRGDPSDPFINGAVYLENTRFKIDFLNAPFNLDSQTEPIIVTSRSIRLPRMLLTDDIKGKAFIQGSIFHKRFSDMNFNLSVSEMKDMVVMLTNIKHNERFYGRAVVHTLESNFNQQSGISLTGPLENLLLRANLESAQGTEISLPLSMNATAKENNFVSFVSQQNNVSSLQQNSSNSTKPNSNFTVELNIKVNPDARFRVIFDEVTNDVLTASGLTNSFKIGIDLNDRFDMDGTFEITKGDYRFNLSNVVNRQFVIKPGSYVTWTGDPYNAQINATAIHVTRAQLFPIVSPFLSDPAQGEQYRRPSRVFAELVLTNKLIDPTLSFNLSLPDADETAKGLVRSVLNSPEEVNRQVFSLLLLGNFLPPENIGNFGGVGNLAAAGLGGNSLSLVSGQINNWLGNVTKDFNLNLDYEAGAENRGDRVTVGLQGQLFNDRVIIDGDLGVGGRNTQSQSNAQNAVVGNVTIEVKATEDGRFRVRAFNRSNEFNLLKNSVPYTQGVGLSYRRDFHKFQDLFTQNKKARKDYQRQRDLRILEDQISPKTISDDDSDFLQFQIELQKMVDENKNQSLPPLPNPDKGVPLNEDDDY